MTRSLFSLLLLSFLACTTSAPRPPATPAQPQLAATATARRVVLMSFDGLGADALARQPQLPAFELLAREGAVARVIPVDPTLTSSAHAAILTGADPQRNGIVSNRFHLPGTPPEAEARGMATTIDVETLAEAARRRGKRVGAVSFPTLDATTPRRTTDFGLAWSAPLTEARIVTLTRDDFKREWLPPTWSSRAPRRQSFSPIRRARVEWRVPRKLRADVDVVAYDTTDDARENYDAYYVEIDERELPLDANGWFAISRAAGDGLHGSWSKFLRASTTLDVAIYWGAISRNRAWPESFRKLLDEEAGFWPGAPEEELEVGPETFDQMNERLAAFYTRAQLAAIAHEPFDLLLLYQPQIDIASHEYLGRPAGAHAIRSAFVSADRAVAAIAEALAPEDALVVTGDHGLLVADRELRVNTLLAERGFAPRWRAFTSGATAQLYRTGGSDDADALVNMLTASGFFERVAKKAAGAHPNTGDVIASAHPNIALTAEALTPSFVTIEPHGQHGALNVHRELHPPLFAYGHGVPKGSFGEISQTRIARFVAGLLGIAAPAAAE